MEYRGRKLFRKERREDAQTEVTGVATRFRLRAKEEVAKKRE